MSDRTFSRAFLQLVAGGFALCAVLTLPARADDKPAAAPAQAAKKDTAKQPDAAATRPAAAAPGAKTVPGETGALPANKTAETLKDATFDDWVMKCAKLADGSQHCGLIQRLADKKGRKIIEFMAARNGKTPYLEVNAPLGLSIPYGVSLVLPDNTEVKMQLADCYAKGCRAVAPLDETTLAKLKGGERIGVRFQDSNSGKVLTVSGSLKGFANGIAKLASGG